MQSSFLVLRNFSLSIFTSEGRKVVEVLLYLQYNRELFLVKSSEVCCGYDWQKVHDSLIVMLLTQMVF